jgi:hypothetical protein
MHPFDPFSLPATPTFDTILPISVPLSRKADHDYDDDHDDDSQRRIHVR